MEPHMGKDVRERAMESLSEFIEIVVQKVREGSATPEELSTLSEVAKALTSC